MNLLKIVMFGLQTDAVDFSNWSDFSIEKLEAAFDQVSSDLKDAGHDPVWCLTDTGDTTEQVVTKALSAHQPDVVLIGAGVRTDPDHLMLFEKVINLVQHHAPQTKIAINTRSSDSVRRVERWAH